jgi:hypothetical protein
LVHTILEAGQSQDFSDQAGEPRELMASFKSKSLKSTELMVEFSALKRADF